MAKHFSLEVVEYSDGRFSAAITVEGVLLAKLRGDSAVEATDGLVKLLRDTNEKVALDLLFPDEQEKSTPQEGPQP